MSQMGICNIQLRPVFWARVFLSALNILACQAAWVSKFPCDSHEYNFLNPPESPFRIDSLHGKLETFDHSTILSLSILAIHDIDRFKCSDLDLPLVEESLRFHALGTPIGAVINFSSICPLPISTSLTPPEGSLFSNFDVLYSFDHTPRLQTVVAEISFIAQDGFELDCVAPKITSDIGTSASAVFTYFPAAVTVIVGMASWATNRRDVSIRPPLFESTEPNSIVSLVWTVIFELSDYLRYLQFMFLAGSLTLEYPGFYQPIIGQAAWASLLYWTGPIDHGFTYTGVEDGMYVSNSSYGLEYMSQMIGFPQMPDIMVDALINLLILVFAALVGFLILYLAMSQLNKGFYLNLVSWNVAFTLLGMISSFFSLPMLSYLSYELILIGYLPNYRIVIVGLSMTTILYSNFLVTRHAISQKYYGDHSSPDPFFQASRFFRYLTTANQYSAQYLPAAVPLLQGIIIGGLQDWGMSQVLVLMGIEIILLLHFAISLRGRLFVSVPAWCGISRLLIICLTLAIACLRNEVVKQWVGYVMLSLHGIMIVFGFLCVAFWRLAQVGFGKPRTVRRAQSIERGRSNSFEFSSYRELSPTTENQTRHFSSNKMKASRQKKEIPAFNQVNDPDIFGGSSLFQSDLESSTGSFLTTPNNPRHYITDFSAFYRQPRQSTTRRTSRNCPSSPTGTRKTSREGSGESLCSDSNPFTGSHYSFEELMEVPIRPDIDYSVRESDAYYGVLGNPPGLSTSTAQELTGESQQDQHILREWAVRAVGNFKRPRKKEKGFQVMRPPLPPPSPPQPDL